MLVLLLAQLATVTPAPIQPPAAPQAVTMVDAATVADAPLRAAYARRVAVAESTVVWRWARDGMLPVPAGTQVTVLQLGRDGMATLQFALGAAVLGQGQARVGHLVQMPIATRPLRTGMVLDSIDRRFQADTLWGEPRHGPVLDVIGWETRAPIPEGMALVPPRVRPKAAVVGGRPVTILWRRDGIDVRRPGIALTAGILGERVRVRLQEGTGPGTELEGRVAGTALVEAQP